MGKSKDPELERTLAELYNFCHPEEFQTAPRNYEELLVKDALYRGATWAQIAESLDVTSENGARHRYRHLLGSPGEPMPEDDS